MPRWGSAQGLELDVAADEIARVGRASGSGASRTDGLRKRATAKVRLVMRRRDVIVYIAADPVLGEKCARCRRRFRDIGGFKGVGLRTHGKNGNYKESEQSKKCLLHGVPTFPKRDPSESAGLWRIVRISLNECAAGLKNLDDNR